MTKTPVRFADLFRYYKGLPHQVAAVELLGERIPASLLTRESEWFKIWSQDGKQPDAGQAVCLKVPYFNQNDNASGTGYRECFSSSCAMVAAFWGKVSGDDEYNRLRAKYGDSTDPNAQIQTLRALGLQARHLTRCGPGFLSAELAEGRPVPVGWLHKGPVTEPTGGGHWTVLIGQTDSEWIHNDPNGEADLINGGYVSHQGGAGVRYSMKNWNRRWQADGVGSGWALQVMPG